MDLGELRHALHVNTESAQACWDLHNLHEERCLTDASGWVQTNAPDIGKGAKVCVSARSIFIWNRLPLEVVYSRNERHAQLPRRLGGVIVNRQLTAGDLTADPVAVDAGWY